MTVDTIQLTQADLRIDTKDAQLHMTSLPHPKFSLMLQAQNIFGQPSVVALYKCHPHKIF